MSVIEIALSAGYIGATLLLALGVAIFFAAMVHAERHAGSWIKPAIIPIIALGICISTLLSGRSLANAAYDLTLATDGLASEGSMALRLLTLVLIGICVARLAGQWLGNRKRNTSGGTALFIALTVFFLSHNVVSSVLGTQPTFIHNILYSIFAFAAVYAARSEPFSVSIDLAKSSLFGMMFLSLLLALVQPNMALEPGYSGWIPGLTVRLWGVGSSPNSIGPLAVVALLVGYMQPYTKKWLNWLCVGATLAVLVLAQSKTVWFSGLVLLPVLAWYRVDRRKQGLSPYLVLALIAIASAGLLFILISDPISVWQKIENTKLGSQLTTLTGRSQIWVVAVNEWLNNPLFGYGPNIWGPAYRLQIGMQFAFSAHNQFLQSLSAAGALGLLSLIAYLWLLGRYALHVALETKGVSVALLLLVLVRSATEAPLALGTLFNGEILTQLLLFTICMYGASQPSAASASPIQPPHHAAA